MTEEMQLQGNARMVKGTKELNQEGCRFFLDSGPEQVTLITSASLRWLTHKNNDGTPCSEEQEEANKKIMEASEHPDVTKMKLKVLLYENPVGKKTGVEHIKTLLKCDGVDIRYGKVKKDHRWRLAMNDNRIFLSKSASETSKVSLGWVCETQEKNDMLVEYFKYEFDEDFEAAKHKRLKLKGDKIVYYDNWLRRFLKWIVSDRGIAIMGIIIGAVIAFILR